MPEHRLPNNSHDTTIFLGIPDKVNPDTFSKDIHSSYDQDLARAEQDFASISAIPENQRTEEQSQAYIAASMVLLGE